MKCDAALFLCKECAKDGNLKLYINASNPTENKCCICKKNGKSISIENNQETANIFKSLIRFYFSEDVYNPHWGGKELYRIFESENPILENRFTIENDDGDDELELSDVISALTSEPKASGKLGVSIYDNVNGYYGHNLQNSRSEVYRSFLGDSLKVNHYLIEDKVINYLKNFVDKITTEIPINTRLSRCRIGTKDAKLKVRKMIGKRIVFPYQREDVSAPPPHLATNGRLNRPGVSFLYLASDENTAISEVKPHPGHEVSVANFDSKRNLKFANFKDADFKKFWLTDEELNRYLFLRDVNQHFSIPIPPTNTSLGYIGTQMISNSIRQLGFDGIIYKSSVTPGTNYVCFNSFDFNYADKSSKVCKISSLKYEYIDCEYELEQEVGGDVSYF